MVIAHLVPVALSLVLLGAHFLRDGAHLLVALVLALLGLLAVRRPWAAVVLQAALLLGAAEWLRTLAELAAQRSAAGQPAARLVIILGTVTLFTAASALVFRSARLRQWYRARPGVPAPGP